MVITKVSTEIINCDDGDNNDEFPPIIKREFMTIFNCDNRNINGYIIGDDD